MRGCNSSHSTLGSDRPTLDVAPPADINASRAVWNPVSLAPGASSAAVIPPALAEPAEPWSLLGISPALPRRVPNGSVLRRSQGSWKSISMSDAIAATASGTAAAAKGGSTHGLLTLPTSQIGRDLSEGLYPECGFQQQLAESEIGARLEWNLRHSSLEEGCREGVRWESLSGSARDGS